MASSEIECNAVFSSYWKHALGFGEVLKFLDIILSGFSDSWRSSIEKSTVTNGICNNFEKRLFL